MKESIRIFQEHIENLEQQLEKAIKDKENMEKMQNDFMVRFFEETNSDFSKELSISADNCENIAKKDEKRADKIKVKLKAFKEIENFLINKQ